MGCNTAHTKTATIAAKALLAPLLLAALMKPTGGTVAVVVVVVASSVLVVVSSSVVVVVVASVVVVVASGATKVKGRIASAGNWADRRRISSSVATLLPKRVFQMKRIVALLVASLLVFNGPKAFLTASVELDMEENAEERRGPTGSKSKLNNFSQLSKDSRTSPEE